MTRRQILQGAASSLAARGALVLLLFLLAPAGAAVAATVPVDLYAVTGTTTLPAGGPSVTVWGYSSTNAAATRPGGPTLIVNQGDVVEITLHNQLATESTGLLVRGQQMVTDRTGVAAGGTGLYSFTASRPGTYLYEAGLLPNAQHQVAMGLYGALVVRPSVATQAYDNASTAFDDEAVLVLSEIDPALNNRANPATFDMRKYAPRYFLINGKAHPNTAPVATTAGHAVLLRYLNAGIQYHSMAVLGAHQSVIALDGNPLASARRYVAETFGPGQTTDAIVTAPATTSDQKLAIFDGSLLLHNSNTGGAGGMLTFLAVSGSGGGTDTAGPATSNVAYAAGNLTAAVSDATTGGADVQAAEYFVDSVAGAGTGTTMTGAFGSASVNVAASVAGSPGQHILYVRGQDSLGNWGPVSSVLISGGDAVGPATTSPTLTPRVINGAGSASIAVHATGSDESTGGSNISSAEFFLDTAGADGTGTALAASPSAPTASLDGTIPAAIAGALAEGAHPVLIHSRDAAGNWGATVSVDLVVDKTGPTTSGVSASPNPNNGTLPFNGSTPAVRVATTALSDPIAAGVRSSVGAAEAFIDAVGANGTGIQLAAGDGTFNTPSETGYADIPLATIAQLSNGNHTISVHARDTAGNWGPMAITVLLIDKTPPTLSGLSATPSPTLLATNVTLAATANDAWTAVTRAEWFRGPDPGVGNGTALTVSGSGPWSVSTPIDVSNWNDGTYTLSVRARDTVGNWSAAAATSVNVTRPLFLSTFGNTNPPGVAGTADDADIYGWSGTAYSRAVDVTAIANPLPAGANVDGFDRVDATHFYLSFAGDVTIVLPGPDLTVQDEDVVFYNAGTWSIYFDGTAHGLGASANLDLDAISIVGGTLYFSTVGNSNPPGVAGTADDADIYSWNGTSYSRVWDATTVGLAAAANVDGYVRVDATHFYLSFSEATTTMPVLGAVQDEDVVYFQNGIWSVSFDGTGHGLGGSDNLDVDAFDVS